MALSEYIKSFTEKSITLLNERRTTLIQQTDILTKQLENILKEDLPSLTNITITGRVKGDNSLREKIVRKRYYSKFIENEKEFIDTLPDIIGVRVTCFLE